MEKQLYTITVNNATTHQLEMESNNTSSGIMDGKAFQLDIAGQDGNRFHVIRAHQSYDVEIVAHDRAAKTITMMVNGRNYTAQIGDQYDALLKSLGMDKVGASKVNELKAPMPGMVLNILVSEGQAVKKGDALIVLEAMKMENILKSPGDGVVKKVAAVKGTAVEKNQVLIAFN